MNTELVLVCQICRWVPPLDLEMGLVQAHFDLEPDHDPEDIRMAMVAMCQRCNVEMGLDGSAFSRESGLWKHTYTCGRCRRSDVVTQKADQ